MVALLTALLFAAPATAGEIAESPVRMSVWAYGEQVDGAVVVDADALARHGVALQRGQAAVDGDAVTLGFGMFLVRDGERHRITDPIDGLMVFDTNGDGYLDEKDPTFAAISLQADGGAARPLAELGIAWISRTGEVAMQERWEETKNPA